VVSLCGIVQTVMPPYQSPVEPSHISIFPEIKLEPRWLAPYYVAKVLMGGRTIELQDLSSGLVLGKYHMDHIELWVHRVHNSVKMAEQSAFKKKYWFPRTCGRETGTRQSSCRSRPSLRTNGCHSLCMGFDMGAILLLPLY